MAEQTTWQTRLRRLQQDIENKTLQMTTFKALRESIVQDFGDNETLYEKPLTNQFTTHLELMTYTAGLIHKQECEQVREHLTQTTNLAQVAAQADQGCMGHRICFLNGKDMEYVFVGDLHSDPESLERLLDKEAFVQRYMDGKTVHLVFTGDYVDRGKRHLDILSDLFVLKALFPDRVTLLRGNHDGGKRLGDGTIKLPYSVPPQDDPMWYFPLYTDALAEQNRTVPEGVTDAYLHWFDQLPIAAVVTAGDKKVFAIHGGLPRPLLDYTSHEQTVDGPLYAYIKCAADLTDDKLTDALGRSIVQNLMWSDPVEEDGALYLEKGRFRYSEAHLDAFCERFGVTTVIRGHQAREAGVTAHFDGKVYTNFSSGIFEDGQMSAYTAYDFVQCHVLRLRPDGSITPVRV